MTTIVDAEIEIATRPTPVDDHEPGRDRRYEQHNAERVVPGSVDTGLENSDYDADDQSANEQNRSDATPPQIHARKASHSATLAPNSGAARC